MGKKEDHIYLTFGQNQIIAVAPLIVPLAVTDKRPLLRDRLWTSNKTSSLLLPLQDASPVRTVGWQKYQGAVKGTVKQSKSAPRRRLSRAKDKELRNGIVASPPRSVLCCLPLRSARVLSSFPVKRNEPRRSQQQRNASVMSCRGRLTRITPLHAIPDGGSFSSVARSQPAQESGSNGYSRFRNLRPIKIVGWKQSPP